MTSNNTKKNIFTRQSTEKAYIYDLRNQIIIKGNEELIQYIMKFVLFIAKGFLYRYHLKTTLVDIIFTRYATQYAIIRHTNHVYIEVIISNKSLEQNE